MFIRAQGNDLGFEVLLGSGRFSLGVTRKHWGAGGVWHLVDPAPLPLLHFLLCICTPAPTPSEVPCVMVVAHV